MSRHLGSRLLLVCAGLLACTRSFTTPPTAASAGAIDGTLDTSPRPELLKGNDVALFLPDGTQAHTVTDANGAFSFTGLPTGTYVVQADVQPAPGGARLFAEKTVPGIVVHAGATTHLGALAPTYLFNASSTAQQIRVVGKVLADLHPDGGGLANPDAGVDLGGTQVAIYFAGDTSAPIAVAVTDGTGAFGQPLLPGTYDLRASNSLFVPGTVQGVVVGGDDGGEGGDGGVQLLPRALVMTINPSKLTGTVLLESDPDLAGADGGAFHPGAGVTVGTTFGGAGVANAAGVFTVANLLGEPDRAFFSAPVDAFGEYHHDSVADHDVSLTAGQTTDMGTVSLLLDRGTIQGDVKMGDGTPAQDISISVTNTHFSVLTSQDPNDASLGHYAISNVPARLGYELRIHREGYQDVLVEAVDVVGDQSTTTVPRKTLTRLNGDLALTSSDPASSVGFTDS